MRRALFWLVGFLAAASALGWWLWPSRPSVERDVAASVQNLVDSTAHPGVAGGTSGPGSSAIEDKLSDDDAQFLVLAQAILQGVPLPPGQQPRRVDDELTRRLFATAAKRFPDGPGTEPDTKRPSPVPPGAAASEKLKGTSLADQAPEKAPAEQRLLLTRPIEASVHEIGERFALAHADQALERVLHAEAELTVRHRDLARLSNGKTSLPADPLGLLSPAQLDTVVESLKPAQRLLQEREALYGTPEIKLRQAALNKLLGRCQAVRDHQEYQEFHADGKGFKELNRQITKAEWEAAQLEHARLVKAELGRLQREAATIPSQQEMLRVANQVRGPPSDDIGKMLFDAVRYRDADVDRGVTNEARLRTLQNTIARELPVEHPARQLKGRQRLLAFVESGDLYHCKRLVHLQMQGLREAAVQGVVNNERLVYLKEWADALDHEIQRRQRLGREEPMRESVVRQRARTLMTSEARHLDRATEANYLAVAQERFSEVGTMPKTVRESVRQILSTRVKEHVARLEEALSEYRAVADHLSQGSQAIDGEAAKAFRGQKDALRRARVALDEYVKKAERMGASIAPEVKEQLAIVQTWLHGPDDPDGPAPTPGGSDPDKPPPGGGGAGPKPGPEGPDAVASARRPDPNGPNKPAGGGRVLATDPTFERCLAEARELGKTTAPLKEIKTEPPLFGKETGRYTVAEADLKPNIPWQQNFKPDNTRPRLPGMNAEWKGRLTPEGKPFDFQKDVKNFPSFKSVGGGIHFGETARWKSPRDLHAFVLRYDLARKQLLLVGPGAKDVFRLEGVEPIVLKALYRFVLNRRNAAISIGWGLERSVNLDPFISRDGSPGLVDPYLPDTPMARRFWSIRISSIHRWHRTWCSPTPSRGLSTRSL